MTVSIFKRQFHRLKFRSLDLEYLLSSQPHSQLTSLSSLKAVNLQGQPKPRWKKKKPKMLSTLSISSGAAVRLISRRACISRSFSTSPSRLLPTVSLVYDLHEPPTPTVPDNKTSPLIVMHGLFGSKKNNRSISK